MFELEESDSKDEPCVTDSSTGGGVGGVLLLLSSSSSIAAAVDFNRRRGSCVWLWLFVGWWEISPMMLLENARGDAGDAWRDGIRLRP